MQIVEEMSIFLFVLGRLRMQLIPLFIGLILFIIRETNSSINYLEVQCTMYIPFTWYIVKSKDLMQGKLFKNQKCTHVLYCSVLLLGGNVNTRRMSKPDMGSIFHIKNRILNEHWCIYSCLQIPPRENWIQYVRRVWTTAINFPCIITLV